MARSEYWSCPLRLPTPAAAHVAIASGVSQRVTSPRRTRARSYSAQFPTRYVVVYFAVLARWSVPSSEHGFVFWSADPSNRSGKYC